MASKIYKLHFFLRGEEISFTKIYPLIPASVVWPRDIISIKVKEHPPSKPDSQHMYHAAAGRAADRDHLLQVSQRPQQPPSPPPRGRHRVDTRRRGNLHQDYDFQGDLSHGSSGVNNRRRNCANFRNDKTICFIWVIYCLSNLSLLNLNLWSIKIKFHQLLRKILRKTSTFFIFHISDLLTKFLNKKMRKMIKIHEKIG